MHLRGWSDESLACTMPVGSMWTNLFEQIICNCCTDSCSTPYTMFNITTCKDKEREGDPEISWGRYFLSSVYEVFANSDHSWIREIAWFGTKVRVRYADSPGYPGEYLYLTCQWDPSRDCCGWVDYCGKSPLGGERLKLLSPSMELEHSSQCMNIHSTNVLLIDSIIIM